MERPLIVNIPPGLTLRKVLQQVCNKLRLGHVGRQNINTSLILNHAVRTQLNISSSYKSSSSLLFPPEYYLFTNIRNLNNSHIPFLDVEDTIPKQNGKKSRRHQRTPATIPAIMATVCQLQWQNQALCAENISAETVSSRKLVVSLQSVGSQDLFPLNRAALNSPFMDAYGCDQHFSQS